MNKKKQQLKRQKRIRAKIRGTEERPRLSVFRSNKMIYAQLINDDKKETILGVSEQHLKDNKAVNKTEKAKLLGVLVAEKAKEKKIKHAVFDKGSYSYHGRIKSVAEGAREGGLQF